MKLSQAIKMAIKSIAANKVRSLLTMLGVIIGLASVIIMVSYAKGQNMAIQQFYQSLGSNRISVYASPGGIQNEVYQSMQKISLRLGNLISGFTPNEQIYNDLNIQFKIKTLSNDKYETYPSVYLGNEQFGKCNNYKLAKGRELSFLDCKDFHQVCILGAATAKELFGLSDPIRQEIKINGIPFTVVGVYGAKAGKVAGGSEEAKNFADALSTQDRMILLPYTMTRLLNNNQPMQQFIVRAKNAQELPKVIALLSGALEPLMDQSGGFCNVFSEDTQIQQSNEANKMQQRFLGGVAAISLLVGGIGIMNIMLVTVKERTREIGVRKAIGAERQSIIIQFLIEAATLCGTGGILGIALGYVGTLIMGRITFHTILLPDGGITVGAFAISVALGIVFGLYPAVKAANLQPVDALRAE